MLIRILLFLLSVIPSWGFTLNEDTPELIEGLQSCQNLSSLTLPAFPHDPNSVEFKMYFWTQKKLDLNNPSLILIPGGPGQTYQKLEWANINDLNIIYFDPRGMGCSTPIKNNLLNNPDFYSAKLVAKDLEQLRIHLKLNKWSVYGHSYGTIPATVYASTYPESVENLILEGTVLKGGKEFWYSQARHDLILKVLNAISPQLKDAALSNTKNNLNSFWFSQGLLDSLPQGFDKELIEKRLTHNYSQNQNHPFTPKIENPDDLTPYFSRTAHLILSCKELAADLYSPKRLFFFDGNSFQFLQKPTYAEYCKEWPIKHDIYDSKDFPLHVPTFYFQGEYDYLTPHAEALEHYHQNQSKNKVFLTLKNGGHNPLSLSLNEFNKDTNLNKVYTHSILEIINHKFNTNDFIRSSKQFKQFWEEE